MKKLLGILAVFVLNISCSGDPGFFDHTNERIAELAQEIKNVRTKNLNYLFTMTAESGTIESAGSDKTYKLTLDYSSKQFKSQIVSGAQKSYIDKSAPAVAVFANRPFPVAGKISLQDFTAFWSKDRTFAKSPPNAFIRTAEGDQNLTVTLEKVSFDVASGDLSFTVKLAPGSDKVVGKNMSQVSMFIDSSVIELASGTARGVTSSAMAFKEEMGTTNSSLAKLAETIEQLGITGDTSLAKIVTEAAKFLKAKEFDYLADIIGAERNVDTVLKKAAIDITGGSAQIPAISKFLNAGILWLYNKDKCETLNAGMDFSQTDVDTLEKLVADVVSGQSWDDFSKAAFASGQVSKDMREVFKNIAFLAGVEVSNESCLKDSVLETTFEDLIKYGSYTAFTLNTYKQVVLAQAGCQTLVSNCF